ncbi:hypothetical protein RRG08_028793 [Elysia crispata]|uniref:Uncharacterized protein n=1 Tax=Elysia crispata TaxID=231223 RepID=A0AAE0XT75_9GAST|nr:hypothetical protein RRG08_028793 [Elysia crispata]
MQGVGLESAQYAAGRLGIATDLSIRTRGLVQEKNKIVSSCVKHWADLLDTSLLVTICCIARLSWDKWAVLAL